MITLLWPHRLLTAVRNLKALSSAVLSFSLTSRLSSVPYSFALYLKSRWRWGQTHVVFFVVVIFTSWHFTLISPPANFLWCLASINDAISSLTEFEKKKRRKTFSHHHLSDLQSSSVKTITRAISHDFQTITLGQADFEFSTCFSCFWLVELVSITFHSIVASICDLSKPWLSLISPLIYTGVLDSPL